MKHSNLQYFQKLLEAYDGDSKEVREQLRNAIMREKVDFIGYSEFLLEGLQTETQDIGIDPPEHEIHARIYRLMEINNILQVVRGYREMIEVLTQKRIDRIKERIYELILNPLSCGQHELSKTMQDNK